MGGNLTWLGDGDPEAQSITQDGMTFVKGEKVAVKDKKVFERLSRNPMFSSEAKPDGAEEGTEKGALKARLRELGVTIQGNPLVDTLRSKLAEKLA